MKVAALDLGSNTFLLLICEVEAGQITKIYRDEIQVTKLGQGVHASKKFHPEALVRAEECLREFSEIIGEEKPHKILAMATSAARDVSNGDLLFRMGEKYGIPIRIIPGHLEAKITFDGATYDMPNKKGVAIIDVGGGSTELIALDDAGQPQGVSVNVGSVRLTEMFISGHPVSERELNETLNYAREKFNEVRKELPKAKLHEAVGVAGTPTTLAAVIQHQAYSDKLVHGYKITEETLKDSLWKMAKMTLPERKALVGMDPQRADVMIAGMAILLAAIQALHMKEFTVSTRGVRNGVALYAAQEK